MEKIFVYKYLSASQLIKDIYLLKKKRNPYFSIRSWAQQLSLKSHGSLQQVIAQKRNLPKKYLEVMNQLSYFSEDEVSYIKKLITYERCQDINKRALQLKELIATRYKKEQDKNQEKVEDGLDLFSPFFDNVFNRDDYNNDYDWISNCLKELFNEKEIKEMLYSFIKKESEVNSQHHN